jgi:hypothetical protein
MRRSWRACLGGCWRIFFCGGASLPGLFSRKYGIQLKSFVLMEFRKGHGWNKLGELASNGVLPAPRGAVRGRPAGVKSGAYVTRVVGSLR